MQRKAETNITGTFIVYNESDFYIEQLILIHIPVQMNAKSYCTYAQNLFHDLGQTIFKTNNAPTIRLVLMHDKLQSKLP